MSGSFELSAEQESAASLDSSVAVSAGAGSGKTRVLAERYVRALVASGGDPDAVLAVTFTKKAAAELRGRIRRSLSALARAAAAEGRTAAATSAASAAARIGEAWIGTFHSIGGRLLALVGPETGRSATRRLHDAEEARDMAVAAARATLDRIADGDGTPEESAALVRLLRAGGREAVVAEITKLRARREVAAPWAAGALTRSFGDERAALTAEAEAALSRLAALPADPDFGSAFCDALEETVRRLPTKVRKPVNADAPLQSGLALVASVRSGDRAAAEAAARAMVGGPKGLSVKPPESWETCDAAEPFLRAMALAQEVMGFPEDLAASLAAGKAPTAADRASWECSRALALLFGSASAEADLRMAAADAVDFQGLLEDVDRLLDEPVNGASLRGRFRHVLVDEFQDTDPLQWRILGRLAAGGVLGGRGLCLVGDEKQAIFGFRGGDVATFRSATDAVVAAPVGRAAPLSDNYRSSSGLVAFVNAVQGTLFRRSPCGDVGPRPQTMVARRRELPNSATAAASSIEVVQLNVPHGGGSDESSAEAEARTVAERLAALLVERGGSGVPVFRPSQCAVLLRSRTHLGKLESALSAARVPFRVLGGTGFFQRPEVEWILQLLRLCLDATDDVAAAAVLRSPLCGLADSALLAATVGIEWTPPSAPLLRRVTALADAAARRPEILPTPEDLPTLQSATRRIARWRSLSRGLPPEELVALVVREADLDWTFAMVDGAGRRSANAARMIDVVRSRLGRDDATLAGAVRALTEAAEDERRSEQADPPADGDEAVSVLTEHGAKGLEWPVVVLPFSGSDLVARSRLATGEPMRASPDSPWLYAWSGADQDYSDDEDDAPKPALVRGLAELRARARLAEEARIFYVALTRAMDRLVIVGAVRGNRSGASTRLGWLREAVPDDATAFGEGPGRAEFRRREAPPSERVEVPTGPDPDFGATAEIPPPAAKGERALALTVPVGLAYLAFRCRRRLLLETLGGGTVDAARIGRSEKSASGVDSRVRGRILHAALEAFAERGDPAARAEAAAWEEGVTEPSDRAALVTAANGAVRAFAASPLGRRVAGAEAGLVFAEMPLEFGAGAVRLRGVADLVLLDRGEALVVDYKSAAPESSDAAARLVREAGYDAQLGVYAAAVRRVLGVPTGAAVYFAGSGTVFPIEGGSQLGDLAAVRWDAALTELGGDPSASFQMTSDPEECTACPHKSVGRCAGVENVGTQKNDAASQSSPPPWRGFPCD